jgi:hypothetical protein
VKNPAADAPEAAVSEGVAPEVAVSALGTGNATVSATAESGGRESGSSGAASGSRWYPRVWPETSMDVISPFFIRIVISVPVT